MIWNRIFMVFLLSMVGLGGSFAEAAVILDQNFDDTGTFAPGITGYVGSPSDSGGRWGSFDANNTRISNSVALSGTQSLIATRGGVALGRTDAFVTTNLYDISYAINRVASNSELIVQVGNIASVASQVGLATFVRANGLIHINTGGAWIATTASAPVGKWTAIRIRVDAAASSYDLYVTPEGGAESFVQSVAITSLPANVNAIRLSPQGSAGTETYFDNALINEVIVPEPAMMGLVGLGGLLLVSRRLGH
ncbi:hypothetical protein [Poriferisphaera sp. WC338]|uniref:hypothetical protein n=1 Tax=Poriferisphaera sp. WC338 TaxID=3425129 RepID=UPI003D81ADA4